MSLLHVFGVFWDRPCLVEVALVGSAVRAEKHYFITIITITMKVSPVSERHGLCALSLLTHRLLLLFQTFDTLTTLIAHGAHTFSRTKTLGKPRFSPFRAFRAGRRSHADRGTGEPLKSAIRQLSAISPQQAA
jgi:hypothetical protein